MLNYIDDEDYRRRILTQLNRTEGRHSVARIICYGQRGEIRKRYSEGQEDQLGALGLVTNAVVLWNTIYMQKALDHLRQQNFEINPEDETRLSPLAYGHINVLGNYSFKLEDEVGNGFLRPLNIVGKFLSVSFRTIGLQGSEIANLLSIHNEDIIYRSIIFARDILQVKDY